MANRAKLTPRDSLILWALVIGVCFGFFMLGVYWGKQDRPDTSPGAQATVSRQGIAQSKPSLTLENSAEPSAGKPDTRRAAVTPLKTTESTPAKGAQAAPLKSPATTKPQPGPAIVVEGPAVKATKPAPQTQTRPAAAQAHTKAPVGPFFTIQLGALKTEAEARRLLTRLEARGYTGIMDKPVGRDVYYRVRVGSYETREAAQRAEALLREAGFMTFIKKIDRGSAN
jgi:cell division septation protein DedD